MPNKENTPESSTKKKAECYCPAIKITGNEKSAEINAVPDNVKLAIILNMLAQFNSCSDLSEQDKKILLLFF